MNMLNEMLFNSLKGFMSSTGIDFLMGKLPEGVRNFIIKTGILKKDILDRVLSGKINSDDIDEVSQNTLRQISPFILEAITHMSKEVGEDVSFCLAKRDGDLHVLILKDNDLAKSQQIEGASFPFEFLATAILSKINEAKVESGLNSDEESANKDVTNLIADENDTKI